MNQFIDMSRNMSEQRQQDDIHCCLAGYCYEMGVQYGLVAVGFLKSNNNSNFQNFVWAECVFALGTNFVPVEENGCL